jgi:hypothetical protein
VQEDSRGMFLEVVTEGSAEWFYVAGIERFKGRNLLEFMLIDCIVYILMYIIEYIVDC